MPEADLQETEATSAGGLKNERRLPLRKTIEHPSERPRYARFSYEKIILRPHDIQSSFIISLGSLEGLISGDSRDFLILDQ